MNVGGNMARSTSKIGKAIGEVAILVVLTTIAPVAVAIDLRYFRNEVGEFSVTEIVQTVLLLTSVIVFWSAARQRPQSRGFLILVAGFLSCMLIREQDSWLDYVFHGFWFWPAIFVAGASITYACMLCRQTVLGPMSAFIDTKPYFYLVFGLLVVLVFSRLFGSGALLWKHAMMADYSSTYKSAVQEGLELFGYVFVAFGSILFARRNDNVTTRGA